MNPGKTATAHGQMQWTAHPADQLLVSVFSRLWGLLKRGTSTTGRRIFLSSDNQARQHGWQVSSRHGGLSRTYRDPRFDYLSACTTCNGGGRNPRSITCSDCQGTGRVSLAPGVTSTQHRGQS
jgi:hypothetical protein